MDLLLIKHQVTPSQTMFREKAVFLRSSLLIGSAMLSSHSLAAGFQVDGYILLGREQSEFGFIDPFGDQIAVNPEFQSTTLGARVSTRRFYLDLESTARTQTRTTDSFNSELDFQKDASRISIGYLHQSGFTIYLGAHSAEVKLQYPEPIAETVEFNNDGPFLGAGYIWSVDGSNIRVSAAYSNRSAEIAATSMLPGDRTPTSDGEGVILDALISIPLTNRVSFDTRLTSSSFDYDAWNDYLGNPLPLSIPQREVSIGFGLTIHLNQSTR